MIILTSKTYSPLLSVHNVPLPQRILPLISTMQEWLGGIFISTNNLHQPLQDILKIYKLNEAIFSLLQKKFQDKKPGDTTPNKSLTLPPHRNQEYVIYAIIC